MLDMSGRFVAVSGGWPGYDAPDAAGGEWPEYPFRRPGLSHESACAAVREALALLRLDAAHLDTPIWNPLRGVVRPGDTVVLKPNFVRDFRESSPDDGECLITHGAVIRAVCDYVYLALNGRGRIVIADAPQNDADFSMVRRLAQLDELIAFYRRQAGFEIEVYDLRPECARKIDGVIVGHDRLRGDPAGYVAVNLGPFSAFAEVEHLCHRLYGAEYDRRELLAHHLNGLHEYLISRTVLAADCVISLPKLKTHKKTGLTANLKNLVGINGNKNWLPHHREGAPGQGGDQFAEDRLKRRVERALVAQFKRFFPLLGPARAWFARPVKSAGRRVFGDTNRDTIRSGNWYGNDTTWRMVIDLNRILAYADTDGRLHAEPVRRLFSLVDGIVAGEGNGPLDPTPRPAGVVLAGRSGLAVDLACARLMGFDHRRIPMLRRALEPHPLPLVPFGAEDVVLCSNLPTFDGPIGALAGPLLAFEPHFGWKGHVEWHEPAYETGAVA